MLTLSRRILVSAPKDSVRLYLRDLEKIADYEQKVDRVKVSYPDAESGFVEVSGKVMGLPWRGAFKAEFTHDGGYRAEMVRGPLPRMVRGIHLRSVLGGTIIMHEERYYFPRLFWPVAYLMKRWLQRSQDRELSVIKEGAELLHRQIQIQQIEP